MRASLILAALLLAAIPVTAGPWQGSLEQQDGATIVSNPETPADGASVLDLRELWRLGEDDEEVFFGVIAQMLHDDEGNIYTLSGGTFARWTRDWRPVWAEVGVQSIRPVLALIVMPVGACVSE